MLCTLDGTAIFTAQTTGYRVRRNTVQAGNDAVNAAVRWKSGRQLTTSNLRRADSARCSSPMRPWMTITSLPLSSSTWLHGIEARTSRSPSQTTPSPHLSEIRTGQLADVRRLISRGSERRRSPMTNAEGGSTSSTSRWTARPRNHSAGVHPSADHGVGRSIPRRITWLRSRAIARSFKDGPNDPVKLHEGSKFVSVSAGPRLLREQWQRATSLGS